MSYMSYMLFILISLLGEKLVSSSYLNQMYSLQTDC